MGSGIQEECSGEVFFLLHVSETSAQDPQIAGGDQIPRVGITHKLGSWTDTISKLGSGEVADWNTYPWPRHVV